MESDPLTVAESHDSRPLSMRIFMYILAALLFAVLA